MQRSFLSTLVSLVLLGLLLAQIAPGQGLPRATGPRQTVTQYLFCRASEPAGQLTALYYSADFVVTGQDSRPAQSAFLQFLQQKYSYKTDATIQQISCTGVHSTAEAKSIEQLYIERDRKDSRLKVIETGWTPGSATPAETAAAPTPAAAAVPAVQSAPAPTGASQNPASQVPQNHTFSRADLSGVFNGSYQCPNPKLETRFRVSLVVTAEGVVSGQVTFNAAGSSGQQPVTFSLAGYINPAGLVLTSHFTKWETPAPARSWVVGKAGAFDVNTHFGLDASFDRSLETLSGFIDGVSVHPSCSFSAQRESGGKHVFTPNTLSAANAPAQATPSPQATNARAPEVSAEDRQFALNEMPRSKAYCETNAFLLGLMDCTCFAKVVFDYRIAHAGENIPQLNARVNVSGPSPLVNVIGTGKLDCSECLPQDKITKWGVEQSRNSLVGASPAQAKTFSECVGRTLATLYKAQPYLNRVQPLYSQAVTSCSR